MIKVSLANNKRVSEFIKSLPARLRKTGMMAITEYIIGNESRGLKKEPSTKFVSRASAYGSTGAKFENGNPVPPGYFSAKQFRFVAWKTKGFTERYERTHALRDDWDFTDTGGWKSVTIFNETPGGEWVMGDQQARQPEKVGWKTASGVALSQLSAAMRFAQERVDAMTNAGKVSGPGSEAFGI